MSETNATPPKVEKPWYVRDFATEKPTVVVKEQHVIERQGKSFVLYAGLLDAAHRAGLQSMHTSLVQAPGPHNGETTIVHATAEFPWGAFTGIGDANPGNVGRMIAPHAIRMAETRAKARALRDALNVGMVAIEELAPDEGDGPPKPSRQSWSDSGSDSPGRSTPTPARQTTGTGGAPSSPSSTPSRTSTPGSPSSGASDHAAEALTKFARLKATATRLQEAGKLAVPDEMLQDFAPGATGPEVESRCQRLIALINSAVQRPASPAN